MSVNKVFENNALKRILVDGGYIEGGNYYFYFADVNQMIYSVCEIYLNTIH
ncbi:MAG: hypothetical protein QM654_18355 [Dysgonamonadaceae bacterium]